MRDVTIYLYKKVAGSSSGALVPARRRIIDYEPLDAALKLLMISANEEEQKRGLSNFMLGVEFYSARVANKTAQINFKFHNTEIALGGWESGEFDHKIFVDAVDRTAKQFPGIERVSICVDGMKNYAGYDQTDEGKCSFPMFSPPAPRKPDPNEMWDVKIYLNHKKAATYPNGIRASLPVKRRVKAADFLTETLKAFDAGATAAERKQGWSSASYGVRFVSAKIVDKKAYVNFMMPTGRKFPDRYAPNSFSDAVNYTVLQFWNEIEEIEICVDNSRNFYGDTDDPMPCEDLSKID